MLFRHSIASRLSLLYTAIFGITLLLVVLASAIALAAELHNLEGDLLVHKFVQAEYIAARARAEGASLKDAAPTIIREVGTVGTRVAVYDDGATFIAGDKSLHPEVLDRIRQDHIAALEATPGATFFRTFRLEIRAGQADIGPPPPGPPPPGHGPVFLIAGVATRTLEPVEGGYVAIQPSLGLLLASLMPYWFVVIGLTCGAIVLSWFGGRYVAAQALRPVNDVVHSLRSLAEGDYAQRRFVTAGGDELGLLTSAYNDAAASVASAMEQRRSWEERMRLFVAEAGHQLRTPLTVIGGYIDVLRRGAVDDSKIARQILGTMAFEKEHMRSLIDRLMRLARLDADAEVHLEQIDVAELLRNQCEAARRLDEQRAIDYSVNGATDIIADRAELAEALWNVVENAMKYAPDAPIHLQATRVDGNTAIAVRDEGPGMSEAERLHAFDRFYRGDRRGEIAGTGLGLSIAKRAVERSGGSIAIDSAPGRGTTVTITL
jgi:signal transduction histidine kinase